MFDLGYQEMAVIAVLAVLFLKPEEVPGVLGSVSHYVGRMRRAVGEILRELRAAVVAIEKNPSDPSTPSAPSAPSDIEQP